MDGRARTGLDWTAAAPKRIFATKMRVGMNDLSAFENENWNFVEDAKSRFVGTHILQDMLPNADYLSFFNYLTKIAKKKNVDKN